MLSKLYLKSFSWKVIPLFVQFIFNSVWSSFILIVCLTNFAVLLDELDILSGILFAPCVFLNARELTTISRETDIIE